MKKQKINVKGMHCKSCVNQIEKKIGGLKGVKKVTADLTKDEVRVEFNEKNLTLKKIKFEISKLGYAVDGIKQKPKSFWQGLAYGLIPHIGCIAFIIASVLGVTVMMNFFRPLLMNRNIFYILIGVSIGFAGLSSVIYLKKQGLLSLAGMKKKWRYLSVMFGSTIGINLVLFMLIFPLLANVTIASGSEIVIDEENQAFISLKVDIPCPGHAPLISNELKTIEGVSNVKFSFPNNFDVKYDSQLTSKTEILKLDVFTSYKPTVMEVEGNTQPQKIPAQPSVEGSCGGSCGGGGCGGGSSCGCGK